MSPVLIRESCTINVESLQGRTVRSTSRTRSIIEFKSSRPTATSYECGRFLPGSENNVPIALQSTPQETSMCSRQINGSTYSMQRLSSSTLGEVKDLARDNFSTRMESMSI